MANYFQDSLGESCKLYESEANSKKFLPGLPLLARLDGRAFHTFVRGLNRPYDLKLMKCMHETTKYLVAEMNALLGYTQSDEISLLWYFPEANSQLPFDGKYQKLVSVMASMCSVEFYKNLLRYLPEKAETNPEFDCRVWQVPTRDQALDVFKWREWDATKNSITMLASSHYSHAELMNKNSKDKHEMIHKAGDNWNNHPANFKRGAYFKKETYETSLSAEELAKIPENKRPPIGTLFTRSRVVVAEFPPITQIKNLEQVIFYKEKIQLKETV